MIRWIAIALYLAGWILSIRPALRRRMVASVCVACLRDEACPSRFDRPHGKKAPRGSIRDRDGSDALAAIAVAAWWWLLVVWLLARIAGRGICKAVLSGRLTAPELERLIPKREAEIVRLTKEIEVD